MPLLDGPGICMGRLLELKKQIKLLCHSTRTEIPESPLYCPLSVSYFSIPTSVIIWRENVVSWEIEDGAIHHWGYFPAFVIIKAYVINHNTNTAQSTVSKYRDETVTVPEFEARMPNPARGRDKSLRPRRTASP
jgi:hypothetical protein